MPTFAALLADNDARNPATEIAILWLTAGLGCDGDTIAMTGATQPSLEELLSGAIPAVQPHGPAVPWTGQPG